MARIFQTGATFITTGTVAGAGISATVGGMGLAGGFGAVGLGTVPLMGVGAVAGAAVYGTFKAIGEGDLGGFAAAGIGAVGGAGFSTVIGGMGLVAPKVGLAFGIGTMSMTGVGAVVGLAAYGIGKMLGESGIKEAPTQVFERMETKINQMEEYSAALLDTALIELDLFLSGDDLKQQFTALEIEDELEELKHEVRGGSSHQQKFSSSTPVSQKRNTQSPVSHQSSQKKNLEQKFAALETEDELEKLKKQVRGRSYRKQKFQSSTHVPKKRNTQSPASHQSRPKKNFKRKFTPLEIEDDFEKIKAKSSIPKSEPERFSLSNQQVETWKCVKTLKEHSAAVNAIAISPDGKTFVSGSNDRNVNLWDLNKGKRLYTFVGQAEAVLSVAISPDGTTLVSGCVDCKISTWKLDTKAFDKTFFYLNSPYSHNGLVYSVAFSPDNRIIASASSDKTIRIWGRYTGELKRILNGHTDTVLSVAFSPDGKNLVSGSADKTIRIWNLNNPKQSQILTGHLGAVTTVAITPDGKTLISGSRDSTIKLWDFYTGKLISTITGHSTAVECIALTSGGRILASSGSNSTIKLWNLATGELLQTLAGCSPVVFTPDGKTLITGGKGGSIKIWRQIWGNDEIPRNFVLFGKWWEVLGVEPETHPHDVKKAYRQLARLYHPDINASPNAKAAMQAINQAYREFRQKYH
ncbi:MAG: DnaJ domain-containing protein [Nostocaceae cyanobacterium]|nr:DnaJ domain-containing protein [Nostocaceae cyanobacterium]